MILTFSIMAFDSFAQSEKDSAVTVVSAQADSVFSSVSATNDSLTLGVSDSTTTADSSRNGFEADYVHLVSGSSKHVTESLHSLRIESDSLGSTTKKSVSGRKSVLSARLKNWIQLPDSSAIRKVLHTADIGGSISAAYEYGVLPGIVGADFPLGGFKTEGNVFFSFASIPLDLSYYYSSNKNVVGLTNYFRLSYDAAKYKERLTQKLSLQNKVSVDQLSKLQVQQQQVSQKIEYLNFIQHNSSYSFPSADTSGMFAGEAHALSANSNSFNRFSNNDSLLNIYKEDKTKYDSLSSYLKNTETAGTGSLTDGYDKKSLEQKPIGNLNSAVDSTALIQRKDSLMNESKAWRAKYDSINKLITELKERIDQVRMIMDNPGMIANDYVSKGTEFLSHLKKFEIGLCNPSYSTFLVNSIPLQGVNIEYVKNHNFIGFSYGTTVNNLLYDTHTLQGMMQGVHNLYNYFDFGNLSSGRKIICLKGGLGTPQSNHLLVGFELGKGKTDYLSAVPDAPTAPYSKESNVVLELDAKCQLTKQLGIDVILGKSSVKEGDLNFNQIGDALSEVLSNYRSYALLTRLNFGIRKTATKLSFTTRWIDPYFKSFGVGFLRSDNLRYELKAEQPLGSKVRYIVTYRRDVDNLMNLYDYRNTLQSINNSLNLKVSRRLNIRLNYAPLFRELRSSDSVVKDVNHIFGLIVSFTPKSKRIISQFNFLYCKNLISTDSANVNFENFTYTHQLLFPSRITSGLTLSWFKNSLTDTLNNDTYTGTLDIGYSMKNRTHFSVGAKAAYKTGIDIQYGFVAKVAIHIYKGLFWETAAEKIIIGDYYNSFNVEQIKRFPYYANTKMILNF